MKRPGPPMGSTQSDGAAKLNDSALRWCRGLRNLQSKQCKMKLQLSEMLHMHAERGALAASERRAVRHENGGPTAAPGMDRRQGLGSKPARRSSDLAEGLCRNPRLPSKPIPTESPFPGRVEGAAAALGHRLSQTISIRITPAAGNNDWLSGSTFTQSHCTFSS